MVVQLIHLIFLVVHLNFNRTIGSAQNFLIGLGIGIDDKNIAIDTRCWRNMIPDGDYHEFHEFLSQYQTELQLVFKRQFCRHTPKRC